MKDVEACDKPRGGGKQPLIRGCPNGKTHCGKPAVLCEGSLVKREPREVKHLSNVRKGNQATTLLVAFSFSGFYPGKLRSQQVWLLYSPSSGERTGSSLNLLISTGFCAPQGVWDLVEG